MKKSISWGAFVLVIFGAYAIAGPTSLGGPASYVIVDGKSMEPTYEHGDLVVTYERDRYKVGDTIVYDAPVDSQFNVIHRIIERTEGGFITQGDNRDEVDGWIAPDDQIYGSALFHIPSGGAIVTFLRQPAAILALFAGWLTFAYLERRGRKQDRDEDVRKGATGQAWTSTTDPSDAPRRRRRRTASPSTDAHNERSWTPRSERRASRRAKRQEQRTTAALLGLAVLVGGSGGVFMAHAAHLSVDAGTLQAFSEAVDIRPPPAETHDITLEARFFNSGKPGGELGTSPFTFEPVEVRADQTYRVAWNGQGNSDPVDCWSDAIDFPESPTSDDASGVGEFAPDSDATHVLCVSTAPGNVPESIEFFLVDADGDVEIELTPIDEKGDDHTLQTTQGTAPAGEAHDGDSIGTPDEEPSDHLDTDQGVEEPRTEEDDANDFDSGSATPPGEDDHSDHADGSSTPTDGEEAAKRDGADEGDEPKDADAQEDDEATGSGASTEDGAGGTQAADEDDPDSTG